MRHRKTWGILGSFAGIASSMAALAYSMILLIGVAAPASASPPTCISEELDLALAEVDEDVNLAIYMQAVTAYGTCMVNTGGPCISEELDAALAQADYVTSVEMRQAAELALMMCQFQF